MESGLAPPAGRREEPPAPPIDLHLRSDLGVRWSSDHRILFRECPHCALSRPVSLARKAEVSVQLTTVTNKLPR